VIPYLKQNYAKVRELKALALSLVILEGVPNLVMILSSKKFMTTSSVSFFVGMASTHLVKYSVAVRIQ
jgi:hypothetical protein